MPVNEALLNKVPEVPKCLDCSRSLSALNGLSAQIPQMPECLHSTYRVSKWDTILDLCFPEKLISQKCCANQMIFVPKLLDQNRS